MPWPLGPADGRYPVRPSAGAAPTHVVVLRGEAAAPPRRRGRRGPAEPELRVSRATVVRADEPVSAAEGESWLEAAGEAEVQAGLDVLERVLDAYRLAAADPAVPSLARHQVLVARLGYGTGEEVADGRHTAARELGVAVLGRPRRRMLAPDGRLAAILVGRDTPLACEELVLRVRRDLDHGRDRLAALGLSIALDTAIAELGAEDGREDAAQRLDELRRAREAVTQAAQRALTADPGDAAREAVATVLGRLEAALRARAARRG